MPRKGYRQTEDHKKASGEGVRRSWPKRKAETARLRALEKDVEAHFAQLDEGDEAREAELFRNLLDKAAESE